MPLVGASTHPSRCSSVDLPQPDGPVIATYSPRRTSIDTSRSAVTGPDGIGNVRVSPRPSTIGVTTIVSSRSVAAIGRRVAIQTGYAAAAARRRRQQQRDADRGARLEDEEMHAFGNAGHLAQDAIEDRRERRSRRACDSDAARRRPAAPIPTAASPRSAGAADRARAAPPPGRAAGSPTPSAASRRAGTRTPSVIDDSTNEICRKYAKPFSFDAARRSARSRTRGCRAAARSMAATAAAGPESGPRRAPSAHRPRRSTRPRALESRERRGATNSSDVSNSNDATPTTRNASAGSADGASAGSANRDRRARRHGKPPASRLADDQRRRSRRWTAVARQSRSGRDAATPAARRPARR